MDWKAIVKSVAPTMGAALGGPVAGTAVKFLADHFLGDTDAQEQDIAELVLHASPEQLMELRSLDSQFKLKMRELDIDVYRLEVEDRKSARHMGIKGGLKAQMVLSFMFIGGYFALTFALFSGEITLTPAIEKTGTLMLGVITGAIPMILQFWFGSSQGSKEKTQAMVKP
ncbi:hypothetical protein [Microbulbifer sp. 2205BS26-8]|uniref:hypothetical protein n=1 Tax=Microbulbifer sp. 2205BS26-8 TaxID=3064386 RepID=UPI00273DD257|nr:hypothetical protein [Microbulbifer sp. 2205BS26-8]MDP5210985.1 hypothetical protein [Microbulbifer sp. 2205BS26-8]